MSIETGKHQIRPVEIDTPFIGIDENGGHEKSPVATGGKDDVVRLLFHPCLPTHNFPFPLLW